ncbi:hypothetical protein CFP56_019536 [Quercus suber]|uniref:Uncharacterized protein n=1 Tax=Quercus suber TaxID=58331 RepID=A0AAW0KID3_QUESU
MGAAKIVSRMNPVIQPWLNLGNDTNEEGIVADSMVASDNNDDVGLERCEGHLNVASQDPVEVY